MSLIPVWPHSLNLLFLLCIFNLALLIVLLRMDRWTCLGAQVVTPNSITLCPPGYIRNIRCQTEKKNVKPPCYRPPKNYLWALNSFNLRYATGRILSLWVIDLNPCFPSFSLWVIGHCKDLTPCFPSLSLKSWLNSQQDSQLKHK